MDSKTKKAIPPATNSQLVTSQILSWSPLTTNTFSAMSKLMLPFIRFEDGTGQGTDNLTRSNYVPYTLETAAFRTGEAQWSAIPTEVSRLQAAAGIFTRAKATNSTTGDVVDSAIQFATETGAGSDILKSILGTAAGLIPGIGPILSNVIQAI